jgi:pimeloyl-ACP methyl ester carboxylesterase
MMTNVTGRPGDSTLRLRDGRRLQVLEIGKRNGFPIFHFHGNGSSRLEIFTVESRAEPLGLRLICPDRPGIGGSDSKPDYQLLDWPDDVVDVADQLGVKCFAVEGFSGGAPLCPGLRLQNPAPAHRVWSDLACDRPVHPARWLFCLAFQGMDADPHSLASPGLGSSLHVSLRSR